MLRQYDEVRPGTSDLLIRWNEEEQAHRRRMEAQAMQANIEAQRAQLVLGEHQVKAQSDALLYQARTVRYSDSSGQVLGWLLCAAAIGGAVYLAMNDQGWVAAALAAIPTAGIIQSFRSLTRQDAREPASSPGSKPPK